LLGGEQVESRLTYLRALGRGAAFLREKEELVGSG